MAEAASTEPADKSKCRPATLLGRVWRVIVRIFAVVLILLGLVIGVEAYFHIQASMGNFSCREASNSYICHAADVVGASRCFGGLSSGYTTEGICRYFQNPDNASAEYRECVLDQMHRSESCIVPRPINEAILRFIAKIKGERFHELDEECPSWHKDIEPIA